MKQVLYGTNCKCKEEILITKKRKSTKRTDGKPFLYPSHTEITCKTFQIKYDQPLSSTAKLLLNSFQKKYLYYAIDDILYVLKSNLTERRNLLAILYSPVLLLQNNFSINFFDIWIHEIYINEGQKKNKFLTKNFSNFEQFNCIKIKLLYRVKVPMKPQESLW
jgi:hypothetical protein